MLTTIMEWWMLLTTRSHFKLWATSPRKANLRVPHHKVKEVEINMTKTTTAAKTIWYSNHQIGRPALSHRLNRRQISYSRRIKVRTLLITLQGQR